MSAERQEEWPLAPAEVVRGLLRETETAALGTLIGQAGGEPRPYVSLTLMTVDHAARPIFLLSDLALHSSHIKADPRVSLLVGPRDMGLGGGGPDESDALALARASVEATATILEEGPDRARAAARIVARHPSAAIYAGFRDFRLYRLEMERAHLVAGFGRITWVEGRALAFDATGAAALAEAEAGIVEHMNQDHADACSAIASRALGRPAADSGWRMTGIDPEGADFLSDAGQRARVRFQAPIAGAAEARKALVGLTRGARG